MAIKRRGGTKSKTIERMLNVFQSTFSASEMKAVSRICSYKTEKNLQIFGWCLQLEQSCLWATLSYFCLRKQGSKINAMRWVVFENALKRAQRYLTQKMEKSPCRLNLLHCHQKTTTSLWNRNEKGIGKIRKMRPQANSAQYNTQGWDMRGGGGVEWEDSGREGVGGSYVPTYIWAGCNGMTIHKLFNSIKKGTFTYSDSNPRDSRNQEMWRWCSQIASDYMKSLFNPLRLVSAPPPPHQLRPLFLRPRSLSSPLLS